MAEITPGSIIDRVAAEIPNLFNDAASQIGTGEGEYIRAGDPKGVVGKIGQAVGRSYCRQYGADPGAARFGNAARIENACRPYLDDIAPDQGATISVPFEGGQCESRYRFLLRAEGVSGVPSSEVQSLGWYRGPITGFSTTVSGDRTLGFVTANSGPVQFASNVPQPQGIQSRQVFDVATVDRGVFTGEIVDSVAGEPDDCGNPPPVVRQPRPVGDPNPPPFRFNPDPDIDVDIGVDVGPDGDIIFDIGTGPVSVDPFPDGPGGGGPDGGGNDPVGGPGSPGGGGDTGPGGDEEGAAEAGEELVGVLVEILDAPQGANRFFSNSELVYRGPYYVAMGYPGRLGLDMSGGTAETLQFFHAQQRGLTDYRVRANVGFNLRVTPYYRDLQP